MTSFSGDGSKAFRGDALDINKDYDMRVKYNLTINNE
jgi:hypothetical protein